MARSRNTADTQTASGGPVSPFIAGKNAVINGGFDIWQRGTSFVPTGSGVYTADRWQYYRSVAGSTVSRQTTSDTTNLPFIQYCARVQRDSGNTSTAGILGGYSLESVNSIPLAGRTVTLSFYARKGANFSNASSQITVDLKTGTGTDQNLLMSGYTGSVTALTVTPTLTTTWQRFSGTVTLASTATEIGLYLTSTPVGTAGAADYFEITGVQLELGSSATPFSRAGGTIQGELAACQRYYYQTEKSQKYVFPGFSYSSTIFFAVAALPVSMRIAPTVVTSGTVGDYRVVNGGTFVACNALPTFETATPEQVTIRYPAATGLTTGYGGAANGTNANAFIGFSSEL